MEDENQNQSGMKRRTFIKAAAAAGVLAAGGAALLQIGAFRRLQENATRQFPGVLYTERLRQIVTQDPSRTRMLMWELTSPAEENLTVELRVQGGRDKCTPFPCVE